MARNIDVFLLRAFLSVVETGSVTKAAHALNLTQAAVSQQIKRLEDLFGATLFDREHRRLSLSATGERLFAQAKRMVKLNDEIWSLMSAPGFEGEVRLGVPHDIVQAYLPPVLRRFDRTWPRVRVTLISSMTQLLIEQLEKGEIDLTLTTERDCPETAELLVPDQLVWVGAEGGDAHRQTPLPASFGAENCIFRAHAMRALAEAGIDWRPVCQVSDLAPLLATIEAGLAVAPMLRSVVPAGFRVLGPADGLPPLPAFSINLRTRGTATTEIARELAREIRAELQGRAGRMAA